MKRVFFFLSFFAAAFVFSGCYSQTDSSIVELAENMSSSGWTMYGTSWCGHCKKQKSLFGSAFDKINYVECDGSNGQNDVCKVAGVSAYPTWINKNGRKIEGVQTLEQLQSLLSSS